MAAKKERMEAILRLINERPVANHRELVEALQGAGFEVTQATVSRDLADLGLAKMRRDGAPVYVSADVEALARALGEFLVSAQAARNLVVLKTLPGAASRVGALVDKVGWEDIVGTVAGDDAIVVVALDDARASALVERVADLKRFK